MIFVLFVLYKFGVVLAGIVFGLFTMAAILKYIRGRGNSQNDKGGFDRQAQEP